MSVCVLRKLNHVHFYFLKYCCVVISFSKPIYMITLLCLCHQKCRITHVHLSFLSVFALFMYRFIWVYHKGESNKTFRHLLHARLLTSIHISFWILWDIYPYYTRMYVYMCMCEKLREKEIKIKWNTKSLYKKSNLMRQKINKTVFLLYVWEKFSFHLEIAISWNLWVYVCAITFIAECIIYSTMIYLSKSILK